MEQEVILNEHNKQEYLSVDIDEYICEIKSCIQKNVPQEFKSLIKYSQVAQRIIVAAFQNQLFAALEDSIHPVTWFKEYKIGKERDSIDIYGKENDGDYNVIIELDKPRADQVAKKIVSRIANYLEEPFIYIAICYPGTDKMNPNECVKYFGYGKKIINKINSRAKFVGCIIDNNLNVEFY